MRKHLSTILAFLILAVCAYGAFRVLADIPKEVAVGIVTGLLALLGVALNRSNERKQDLAQKHRAEQVEVYQEFIRFLFTILRSSGMEAKEEEVKDFFFQWAAKLLLVGSDEVILAYNKYKAMAASSSGGSIIGLGELILAIRKDLGHDNKGLSPREIYGIFIIDADQLFESSVISDVVKSPSGH